MMFRKLTMVTLVLGFMIAFSVQSATATDPKWREKQQARFEQIGLKPGDIIGKANWEKANGLAPPAIIEWLKKDYIEMKIAAFKYDVEADDEWINAGPKNAGKFKLDDKKNLVEAATGKPPLWVYGIPFPNLDMKDDPDGAAKFMNNRDVSVRRMGSSKQVFILEWIGPDGFERELEGFWANYYYWARADGQVPNPNKRRHMDISNVLKPYDVAGTAQLTFRKLDGTEDELYAYIPAIRRVKKMSGANRSDPFMGSDVCVDDADGWSGLTNSMKWRVIGERLGLLCVVEGASERTIRMKQLPDGTWRTPPDEIGLKLGWEGKDWDRAKWAPANVVWIPRTFIVIEALPLDPYYNYGKTVYWIDKETYWINYKTIWDRAGEYWKTIIAMPRCVEWAGNKGVQGGGNGYIIVDEKMNHTTAAITSGMRRGREYYQEFNNPKVNPRMFTVPRLHMWSK
jgi:hypothetical protein